MAFGISLSVKGRVRECTPALLNQVLDSDKTRDACAEIEDALERVRRGEMSREDFETFKGDQKRRLPIITPHATFPKGRRCNEDAVASGLSMYDVDHILDERSGESNFRPPLTPPTLGGEKWVEGCDANVSLYQRLVAHTLRREPITDEGLLGELKRLGICMVHVTPSTEGFRLIFAVPAGMTLEEAQRWMSEQLDDENYDGCVKDMARCSFLVPRSYVLYMDEEELFKTHPQPLPKDGESNLEGGIMNLEGGIRNLEGGIRKEEGERPSNFAPNTSTLQHQPSTITHQPSTIQPQPSTLQTQPSTLQTQPSTLAFKGIPYKDIIAEWFCRTGGEPHRGERNDKLHRLAVHLRYITDNDERTLLEIMPRYGLTEEEMRGLIHSACKGRFCSIPKVLQGVIDSLTPTDDEEGLQAGLGLEPPQMPKTLPPLIKLLTRNTPDIYKPAVSQAVFPSLGAHLYKTRFRYIDNVEHEATLMNVLMAGTGAGKDCITEPINRIMADIRRRDEENMAREKAWKQQVNSRGANKDKAQRPEGLVIQEIDADVTNAAFVQRMSDADGHFLYAMLNEIDQFDALKGNGRLGQQFQIMCLAFDHNHRYGQTRIGTQSVTEKVTIRFNWNASTTIINGRQYFRNVLTKGPISRINFCTIPEREIGAEMPVYGTYDAEFDEQLRPYIERLTSARGLIECQQAFRLAVKLKDECADFSRLSQNRTYENLSFRALVIAYLKACVLYVAHDYHWDKTMEKFIRWSLHYDLWCKMHFFGEDIEQSNEESKPAGQRGPRNLLGLLPDEFTLDDAVRVRRQQGLSREGTLAMIRTWRNRGYIEAKATEGANSKTNEQLNSFLKLKFKGKEL